VTRFADRCAFFGVWLLFAGPVYQAETELDAEGREIGELRQSLHAMERPPEPSRWLVVAAARGLEQAAALRAGDPQSAA
jgi:hypothetical protein